MKQEMREELDTYKKMVRNWGNSYLRMLRSPGDNEWVVMDLKEDIEMHMSPMLRRFTEVKYLTSEEVTGFWQEVYKIVMEVQEIVIEYDGGADDMVSKE